MTSNIIQFPNRRNAKPATLDALRALGLPEIQDDFAQFESRLNAALRQDNGIPVFIAAARAVQDDDVLKPAITPDRMVFAAKGAIDGIYRGSQGDTENERYGDFLLCAEFAQSHPELWRLFTEGGLFEKAITKSLTGRRSNSATDICKLAAFGMQHDELAEIAQEKFLAGLQEALTKKEFIKIMNILKLAYDQPLWMLITPPVIGQIIVAFTKYPIFTTELNLRTIFGMVKDDPTRLSEMVPGMVTILAKDFIQHADIPGFMKLARIAEARHDWQSSFGQAEVADAFLYAWKERKIDGSAILTELQNTAHQVAEAFVSGIELQMAEQAKIDARKSREASIRSPRNVGDDKEKGEGGQGFNGGHARRGSRGRGFGPGLG